ncbi:MAG TPA: hypothetical protein VH419_16230 [Nocardioidaceae bacterium]
MSKVVYLHVGLHKTGTTYLQDYFSSNREGLVSQGVDFPSGDGEPVQVLAAYDLRGRRARGYTDKRVAGHWAALTEHIRDSPAPVALVSQESLALATLKEARRAVASFPDLEVHVVVTARDLGRTLVSMWQEEIKAEGTWTWREYADAVKDADRATSNPAFGFWRREDLIRVCDTWAAAATLDHLHIVTVPPSGTDHSELVRRVASVVGFDPTALTEPPRRSNEMIGVPGIEVLRQVNVRLGDRLNERARARAVRGELLSMLARPDSQRRAGLPESEFDWVSKRADSMVETVRSRGFHVVGDLDDLRPRREDSARSPDDATDAELFEAAVDALAQLTERYGRSWWSKRRSRFEDVSEGGTLRSRLRGRTYKLKVKMLATADRSKLAAKAVGVAVDAEARKLRRARNRG